MSDLRERTIRASSWPSLFDCALRWRYQNLDGLRMPSSGAAHLGTAIHAGTAAFDQARLDGSPISIDDAAGALVNALRDSEAEVVWGDDLSQKDAEKKGIAVTARYCAEIAPQRDYAAVELPCESLVINTHHGPVRVTGTTDRIRRLPDGSMGVSDLKSGARAVGSDGRAVTKGHHLQLGIYTLLAEAASGQELAAPAEIIGLGTTGKHPVGTGEIADCTSALIGTEEEPGLIEIAAQMLASGIYPPNPKSMLCSAKFCPGYQRCRYHD